MYIKKESVDEDGNVPSFPIKMELPEDSLDIKNFQAEETLEEVLEEGYSNFPTLEPIKKPFKLEPNCRTCIKVGFNKLNSKLHYFLF